MDHIYTCPINACNTTTGELNVTSPTDPIPNGFGDDVEGEVAKLDKNLEDETDVNRTAYTFEGIVALELCGEGYNPDVVRCGACESGTLSSIQWPLNTCM